MQCTEDMLLTNFFFQQILLYDEVLKVLNILKLGAAVFVGTTWEETCAGARQVINRRSTGYLNRLLARQGLVLATYSDLLEKSKSKSF